MAAYWVVILHKGMGQLGGLFTNLSDAKNFVSQDPLVNYHIVQSTVDALVNTVAQQVSGGGVDPATVDTMQSNIVVDSGDLLIAPV